MIRRCVSPLRKLSLFALVLFAVASLGNRAARAEFILATRYFTAGIDIYDRVNDSTRSFITIPQAIDPFPGLTGLAYSASLNRLYATANSSQRIYSFNAASGAYIGYHQFSGAFSPAGITADPSGDLYVADNQGSTIRRFTPNPGDASLTESGTIQLSGAATNPNGLAWTAAGDLIVSSAAGAGVFRYATGSGQADFNVGNPLANGQVAVDLAGNVAVGGVVFSSSVSLFNAAGTQTGSIAIDSSILPQPAFSYVSSDITNPQGVAYDSAGNLIVAAMGRTNPFSFDDNFQSNGGIFVFDPTGTTLLDSLVNTTPYTSVIVAPVPEPAAATLLAAGGTLLGGLSWRSRRRRQTAHNGSETTTG